MTNLSDLSPRQIRSLGRLTAEQTARKVATYRAERTCKIDVAHRRMVEGPLLGR